ncbi:hypothetical protein ACG2F4_19515, partial [Halalkalibaculum sp. DA3122]|uniref:hypothetical protein n=1 Tax=unclassified Halalkalibaculum TaxID=2964617 RepID=UPI0037551196
MGLREIHPEQIKRYVTGEYSREDEKFVNEWLDEDPAREEELEEVQNLWDISGNVLKMGNKRRAWDTISEQIKREKKTDKFEYGPVPRQLDRRRANPLGMLLRIAAVLLV